MKDNSRRSFILKSVACTGFVLSGSLASAKILSNNEVVYLDEDACIGCEVCYDGDFFLVDDCPVAAWWIDSDGFPHIETDLCIDCGVCAETLAECPVEAIYYDAPSN